MGDIISRRELSKQGLQGFGGVAGGVGILILKAIAASTLLGGLVVGGIIAVGGLMLSSSKDDKKVGMVAVVAGGLTILASLPVLKFVATPFMLIGGIGLLLAGGWSLFKFFRGLKNRD